MLTFTENLGYTENTEFALEISSNMFDIQEWKRKHRFFRRDIRKNLRKLQRNFNNYKYKYNSTMYIQVFQLQLLKRSGASF